MKQNVYLCLTFIFAVLCSGCPVESVNPLSNLGESKHDEQLSGAWISKCKSGEAWYLHIGKGEVELGPNSKSLVGQTTSFFLEEPHLERLQGDQNHCSVPRHLWTGSRKDKSAQAGTH